VEDFLLTGSYVAASNLGRVSLKGYLLAFEGEPMARQGYEGDHVKQR
jgi:hypothetical protein